jgi:hypothetical protein
MKRFYIKIAIVAMLPVFIGCKEKALEGKQFDTFIKFFGTSDLEIGYDLKTTADGGYILAGTQTTAAGSDIYVVKTDRFGNQEWTRNIGGSASESASAIAIAADGNYVVAGYVEDASGNRDVFLAKFDAAGVLWQSTFGGAENEEGAELVITDDGGYAVAGYSTDATGDQNALLAKFDGSGTVVWTKDYGALGSDWATSLLQKSDGGYVLAASTNSYSAPGLDNTNFMIVETNSIGDEIDRLTYGTTESNLNPHLDIDNSTGNYVIAGTNVNAGANTAKIFYFTCSQSNIHSIATSSTLANSTYDACTDLIVDSENNFLITGNRDLAPAGSAERQFSTLYVRIGAGEVTEETVGSEDASNQTGHSIVETSDGRVAIVGSNDEVSLSGMMTLIKLSKTGQLSQ